MVFKDLLQRLAEWTYSHLPQSTPHPDKALKAKIIAHRGAWKERSLTENTIEAFQQAMDAGVWAIEFDIRWTMDEVPVIFHDSNTSRINPEVFFEIEETLYSELKKALPKTPTFTEVVERFGKKVHLMIELKTQLTGRRRQIILEALQDLEPVKDYHLLSMDIHRFQHFDNLPKETFVSIAEFNIQEIFDYTLRHQFGAMTGHFLLFHRWQIQELKKRKKLVGTGFPTTPTLLYRELNRDVDWIFTNDPIALQKELNQLKAPSQSF
ncbi:MAG: glycerophosphodiester phosphodiesterase [Bdellovibrionales bacterium]|nr:glycerophosphodiester phosphodiesterase [Bdellovibrionales bacterium]